MVRNWIAVLNVFLFFVILVASISIPADEEDAMLIGAAELDIRKSRDWVQGSLNICYYH